MEKQRINEQLTKYLSEQHPDRSNISLSNISEINMGWETELFTLEINYDSDEVHHKENRVLRIFSGESAGNKVTKEYQLMKTLYEAGYPVPEVYHNDTTGDIIGKPFILMKRIMGKTLDDTYNNETPEEADKGLNILFRLFHRLHQLDITEFTDIPGVTYTEDTTKTILDYYSDCVEDVLPWIEPVVLWLQDNKPETSHELQSLLHLDYHGMNVMMDEDGKPYVIDWSAAMIADYRLDLAWTVLLYTTFGGEFFRDLILGKYSELSGKTIENIEYYEVIAATRRIIDFGKTVTGGSGASGLKPEIVEIMKDSKEHFMKVHDFLTARTGIRLEEFDQILNSI